MREIILELVAFQSKLGTDLLKNDSLDLPNSFPCDLKMMSNLCQRMRVMMDQPEPALQDLTLPIVQDPQELPDPVTF